MEQPPTRFQSSRRRRRAGPELRGEAGAVVVPDEPLREGVVVADDGGLVVDADDLDGGPAAGRGPLGPETGCEGDAVRHADPPAPAGAEADDVGLAVAVEVANLDRAPVAGGGPLGE